MRMAECGQHPGFTLESLVQMRIAGHTRRQDFDGDRPIQPRVPCLVNLSHSSATRGSKEFIRTQASAGHETMSEQGSVGGGRDPAVKGVHGFTVEAQE